MKEKNLTYICAAGDPATKDAHEWLGVLNGAFYTGPAIDRLHEFEKIGLEPESIKKAIDNQTAFIGELRERIEVLEKERDALESTKDKFMSQNRRLIRENGDLRALNQRLYDKIADLEEKNKNLGYEIDNLVAENKALIETTKELQVLDDENRNAWGVCNELKADNARLKKRVDYLEEEIVKKDKELYAKNDEIIRRHETHLRLLVERDNLARENESLRDNMDQMKKIVGPADFEKEIADLKSQLKKQTEITEDWRTDAMNHYRKYVNILDERAALQKKLADIEKIAKEE